MTDPPAVLQDDPLQTLAEAEALVADLQDVNAEVSAQLFEKLQRLRVCIERSPSSSIRSMVWDVIREVLRVVAIEVVRRLIETSISHTPVLQARERSYTDDDGRRVHQDTARVGWAQAA